MTLPSAPSFPEQRRRGLLARIGQRLLAPLRRHTSALARRLTLAVLLFSSSLALLITLAELTTLYREDVRQIELRMGQIRDAYLDSVTHNVWVMDRERIDTLLLGITRLPDFVLAEIRVDGRTLQRHGQELGSAAGLTQVFELQYLHQGRLQHIGELVVQASFAGARSRVLERAVFILLANGAKTLLVALFLLILVYRMVGRHLERVAGYAGQLVHSEQAQPLALQRERPEEPDEFDSLVAAINRLRLQLRERERHQREQLQRLAEQAALLELAHDAIIVRDMDNRIVYWNSGAERLYGWSREQAQGRAMHVLLQSNLPQSLLHIEDALMRTGYWEGQIAHSTRRGERIIVASRWALQRDANGAPQGVLEINRDVTERRRYEERIQRMAYTDALTQLPNRLGLEASLAQALEAAQRNRGALALFFVDLDRFKQVNDAFGHAAGDRLLVEVAQRLQSCVREVDLLARLGSDEFIVVLTSLKHDGVALPTAAKIQQTLRAELDLGSHRVRVDCSIGVACYPAHAQDAQALLRQADTALHLAKSQGGGLIRLASAAS